ncbi:S1 family peptidase [Streptomyces lonarensis]|uniref:S1 family peptidase n=1 Tax=Streptomyces lonarensis TaxID=700599 RepID=A0A7X6CZ69_9ACTN|nr:S1 family peptidase [Streptomyces lonarensis]NJQ05155.1 S1 family peptidase [Streptomyces lonarensis]
MRLKGRTVAIGSALAASALALSLVPANASSELPSAETAKADALVEQLPAGMVDAMERDLGVPAGEVGNQLVAEHEAAVLEESLSEDLSGYAGSWIVEGTTEHVVATTDRAEAAEIAAAGATATVVEHSLAELEAVKEILDEAATANPADAAPVWYVDVTTNEVVVLASDVPAAEAFVAASGADASTVRVERSNESPQPFYDLVGGDAYYIGGGRCSIGFSVRQGSTPGFVTAGHCGSVGNATTGFNRVSQGTFRGSWFPGRDMAWVAVNSNWTPTSLVRNSGSGVRVTGSTQATVGSSICRSGSTTGWRCGTIQQHNTSVTYPQGTITGVTRTSACAQPGDSGGSFVSGTQAQGVTSGGSGNCTFGGTTFHQPVNPILSQYGLTLVRS